MRIDARDIIITGSASLGFSLNPNKNFKSFDKKSDIDISIISHHYFDVAWHDLIHLSPAGISPKMKTALEDHRKRLIYWGTVATDKILPLLSFGGEWDRIIKTCQLPEPLVDHEINFRIYKDALSIRNYIRFLYKGIIIKHNKTEPTYTKTSLFLCEKRRFFMARTEKGVVTTI